MSLQATAPSLVLPSGVWGRECVAEIRRSFRLPQFILPTVMTPAAFFGLFNLAIGHAPPAQVVMSLAGYGVFAAIGPAMFGFGAGLAMEREQGLIELKRVSPMPAGAYLAAKLAASTAVTLLALVLIYGLAMIGGARLSPQAWAMLAVLHLASGVPHALIGFGIGMRMGGKGAVAIANAVYLGSAVTAGLWFPASLMPAWLRSIGLATPAYHLGQLAHAVVGAPYDGSLMVHGALVLGMTALAALWARSGWRRSPA